MARRHRQDQEIPFVALLDTITNVVGILIIILVTIGIAAATAVKKVMLDLPHIDEETLIVLRQEVTMQQEPQDPDEVRKKVEALDTTLNQHNEEIKSLDKSLEGFVSVNIDDLQKQLAERTKVRDTKKTEVDTMLAEVENLKAIVENTPVLDQGPPSIVRMPNPRPYPENAKELRIYIAQQGSFLLDQQEFVTAVTAKLNQSRSQLVYRDPAAAPFGPMMEKILGEADARKAWPDIAEMAGTYQMDGVAKAWKAAKDAGVEPTKQLMETAGSLSLATRKPMGSVMEAIIAATKGDYDKWVKLDPSTDALNPTIKVEADGGNRVIFHWGGSKEEVRPDERNITNYFRGLADADRNKDAVRSKVIYDAYKISDLIKRELGSFAASRTFNVESEVIPGRTTMLLKLSPKTGEPLDQMRQPNSNYIQSLRNLKSNPNGVALFLVSPDAIPTYLEARLLAEDVGVPASWNFMANVQDIQINVPGFEVQRFAETPPPAAPGPQRTTIRGPRMGLD